MADTIEGIDWFDGVASGQQRSALQRLEPSHVMISHATANNKPWDGDYTLFTDSGGYHFMMSDAGDFTTPDAEYIDYIETHEPELWALRDYACEPAVLEKHGRSVEDHQRMTNERHASLLDMAQDRGTPGQPVSVLQGWVLEDYLNHIDALRERGLLTDYVAIGSVCRRNQDHEIANIILRVREALPAGTGLHAFGVKSNALRFREVVEAIDSADSAAYDVGCVKNREVGESFTWRDSARGYLNFRHKLSKIVGTEQLETSHQQMTLTP